MSFANTTNRNSYIINQRQKGVTNQELADELGITIRTVSRIYSTYQKTRQVGRKPGSGRTKVLTAHLKLKILRIVEANPGFSCRQIADRLDNEVSDETVRLYLKSQDFSYKKRSKIPNLSEKDKELR